VSGTLYLLAGFVSLPLSTELFYICRQNSKWRCKLAMSLHR